MITRASSNFLYVYHVYQNKKDRLDFLKDISKTDLSLLNLYNQYPKNRILIKLRPPTSTKARQASYEEINPHLYEQQTWMFAFRVYRERVYPLIKNWLNFVIL